MGMGSVENFSYASETEDVTSCLVDSQTVSVQGFTLSLSVEEVTDGQWRRR
jgi:hypothetical protein